MEGWEVRASTALVCPGDAHLSHPLPAAARLQGRARRVQGQGLLTSVCDVLEQKAEQRFPTLIETSWLPDYEPNAKTLQEAYARMELRDNFGAKQS